MTGPSSSAPSSLPTLASMPEAVRRAADTRTAARDASMIVDRWSPRAAAAIAEVTTRAGHAGPASVAVRLVEREDAAAMARAIGLSLAPESTDAYLVWSGWATVRTAAGERQRPVTITWSQVLSEMGGASEASGGVPSASGRRALAGGAR